ncbi:MAG: hydroxymethylglutaryl-CoA reductase, degradative [archaeon]
MTKSSELSGFYKLTLDERLSAVKDFADLTDEEVSLLKKESALPLDQADRMVENAIGTHALPLGVAVNFLINNKDYIIPMAIEEPSVIAAASNTAKLVRATGGFRTSSTDPIMIGQIYFMDIENPAAAKEKILSKKQEFLEIMNSRDPLLIKYGGGARDIEVDIIETSKGPSLRVHILVDCRDAMGANAINTMVEALSPELQTLVGGDPILRIISNLADRRLARAEVTFPKDALGGAEVVEKILRAYAIADADPYRACTHNKGVMNGISAVIVATGNDWRAVEAGAHAYASRSGQYKPLTKYEINNDGDLVGSIELPMAVGLVGGATKVHPTAQVAVKILGVKSANELGEVIATVGLAQNFAAIRAIATEGIQKGHMRLHARNIAASAGAKGAKIDEIAEQLISENKISMTRAKELLSN